MLRLAVIMALAFIGLAAPALPHSGGLNKDGCHNNRKTGEYHCHRGQAPSKAKARLMTPAVPQQALGSQRQALLSASTGTMLPAGARAVDGDTIKFKDKRPDVRLVGCDTPESRGAECDAERKLAKQAKNFLQRAIDTGRMDLEYVPCSCPPGTESTKKCNHGRACGIVRIDGRNICDVMIDEGLAVAFTCEGTSCPPMPKWCEIIPQ